MGLFSKKLDYSSGNGVLPRQRPESYSALALPNSSTFFFPDMALMMKERDQGTLENALAASIKVAYEPKNVPLCTQIVQKYISGLKERLAPNLNAEETELLAKLMRIGCGMAIVESESGLMIQGKSHPSIMNVYSRFRMNMGEDMLKQFESQPVDVQLPDVAIEVGYVGTRMNGSPSVEEMFASVAAFK